MIPLIIKIVLSAQANPPKIQAYPRVDKPITIVIPVYYKEF
jgi:hypothetical protein